MKRKDDMRESPDFVTKFSGTLQKRKKTNVH
jgi:hypothetical protein